ncbi:hypothetical protein LI328DRAFT_14041 [Trichoderma asperelloides]|nr:hypothetical protein LI328DRAFT_14041 [Trichoderma asperelloides]
MIFWDRAPAVFQIPQAYRLVGAAFCFLGSAARFSLKRCAASDLGKDKGVGGEIGRDVFFYFSLSLCSLSFFFFPFFFLLLFSPPSSYLASGFARTPTPIISFGYDRRIALFLSFLCFSFNGRFVNLSVQDVIRARISYVCFCYGIYERERTPTWHLFRANSHVLAGHVLR